MSSKSAKRRERLSYRTAPVTPRGVILPTNKTRNQRLEGLRISNEIMAAQTGRTSNALPPVLP